MPKIPSKGLFQPTETMVAEAEARLNFRFEAAAAICPNNEISSELVASWVATHDTLVDQSGKFTQQHLEERLATQIAVLDHLFYTLANTYRNQKNADIQIRMLELGLRCHEQSRRAIATLDSIKHPRKATFIKNAIAQQVNQLQIRQQELEKQLEANQDAPMDFGSQTETGRANQNLETVGAVNWSQI